MVSKPESHRRLRQDILFVTQTTISISERDHASSVPRSPDILIRLTEARNPQPPCRGDPRGDTGT